MKTRAVLSSGLQGNIFSQYLEQKSIFRDKKALSSAFVPSAVIHRDQEVEQLTSALAPVLRGYNPSNIFIYGTCGTGKTICTKFVLRQLQEAADSELVIIYVNCKMKKVADTEYRLFAQLLKEVGEFVPDTGLPTDVLYRKFFEKVESMGVNVIVVLDEIDALLKKIGDDFLYNFTRINGELKESNISIIGITNDLSCRDTLDMRIKSSLSEEEIIFKPYDATQLCDILLDRINIGFMDDVVSDSVAAKCAALAAQEHGDARRALDLLRVSGEIAERDSKTEISERHVDMAEKKIDMDRVTETVRTQPMQSRAVLYSIILLDKKGKSTNSKGKKWADRRILTGDVYSMYKQICERSGINVLTQRRVSDLISELDMLGIIQARIISKGRHGRTREIFTDMNETMRPRVERILTERFN